MSYFDSILPKNTGTEILGMANESANASARDARSARIAELEAELAEIRKQKASLDTEADMGKYKFQYDADPSTYTTYKQNLRTAEQTEKIRKANEKATDKSQNQNMLKELGTGLFTSQYSIQAAENAVKEAIASGNPAAIRSAKTTLSREQANYRRLKSQYDTVAAKVMKDLGVDEVKATESAEAAAAKLDLDNDSDVLAATEYDNLKADIKKALDELRKRPDSMDKKVKQKLIDEANKKLAAFRERAGKLSSLSPSLQAELETSLNAYSDAIPGFRKSQPTNMTPEQFAALAAPELKKLGHDALVRYKQRGFTNPRLEWAIKATAGK